MLSGRGLCTICAFNPEAIRAMEAGAHVFVEKPLATTVADAETVVATAIRLNRKLVVGIQSAGSERTVKAHLTNIYNKLGVDSRAGAGPLW